MKCKFLLGNGNVWENGCILWEQMKSKLFSFVYEIEAQSPGQYQATVMWTAMKNDRLISVRIVCGDFAIYECSVYWSISLSDFNFDEWHDYWVTFSLLKLNTPVGAEL